MKFYLFWSCGGCIDQSHDCGVEVRDTYEEVQQIIAEKKDWDPDTYFAVIHGRLITSNLLALQQ